MKTIHLKITAALGVIAALSACQEDAAVASYNISKAADNFEVTRKTVFYNGITGDYMLELIGRCSIEDKNRQLEVTCKTSAGTYAKHFLGLSDNVTYFTQQRSEERRVGKECRTRWAPYH